MYNLAIRKCTSPPLLALRLKIYYPTGDRTLDLLNQRQTCYHLSQYGELCTSECADECHFSANLCKRGLDVTAGVVVEATRNADILTINANAI